MRYLPLVIMAMACAVGACTNDESLGDMGTDAGATGGQAGNGQGGTAGAAGSAAGSGGSAAGSGGSAAGSAGTAGSSGTGVAFDQFVLNNSAGPCQQGEDCTGSITLNSQALLSLDRFGEPGGTIHTATVSQEDLQAAIAVLTAPALVQLLDLTEPPCQPPTDIYEQMALTANGVVHDNSTTTCTNEPIQAARKTMQDLADKYLPVSTFEKFTLNQAVGPCDQTEDCVGFIELNASGLLRVDKMGELPSDTVHEVTITKEELLAATTVLTDPDLIALLDLAEPPCNPPTDIFESMTLVDGGTTHDNSTTSCTNEPLQAARNQMTQLATTYFP